MDMEILQDYLPEARELLEKAQEDTLRLESEPGSDEILASVFRAFHTLKGGAGFLEADHLVSWTHHLEDLLDKLRSHTLTISASMIDAILKGLDVIDDMLQQLAHGESPAAGPEDLGQVIQQLAAGQTLYLRTPTAETDTSSTDATCCPATDATLLASQRITVDGHSGIYIERADTSSQFTPSGSDEISEAEFEATLDALYGNKAPGLVDPPEPFCPVGDEISPEEFERVLDQLHGGQAPGYDVLERATQTQPASVALELDPPASRISLPVQNPQAQPLSATPAPIASPSARAQHMPEAADTTLRVDALRLDAVMNQVGELVLLRNRLASAVSSLGEENEDMARIAREVDLTVNDIQSTVMRLRMQPCKRLFQQLPRVVRDASRQLAKEVKLDIIGEEVEIDKAVVDALSGPMTHLIRNSLDHGIEPPELRQTAGKPRSATIRVAAVHLGDKVRIEVSDDGRGIDRQFVTQKAIDKGVITTDQAARLSEQEALELIFRAGFSTKDQATDLSGRGVGMDVVKETVRKLRGHLDIQTRLGLGTTIAMEFPLTMAVLPVLYLRLRREIYALPISSIESLLDIQESRIHRMGGRSVYRLDGTQVTPMVDLGALLNDRPLRLGSEPIEGVLTERGLFMVSEVLGNEDSVVKPIDFLAEQTWYQGATISGKGNVVLILDPGALIGHALDYPSSGRTTPNQRGAA
ncbi:chemotaxis protein CheA [Acidithiobacillus sp.]|jgi:two-component system chemotaxis sensor kinase CheA|uniref:chemotaxis protein CheA n=1 Tax=Acidithiobacillus sp. TaxID=1872118 RepID=UPI0025BAD911|nr:chemotaxis protein CheA [Acidithiobacillus sp.]MCK9187572.1 chemotaxis protein CheA [Acidithiobacillus sp.]MCK9358462.1 chemotaxis protein CheA [Acidithiobacillus sp.]